MSMLAKHGGATEDVSGPGRHTLTAHLRLATFFIATCSIWPSSATAANGSSIQSRPTQPEEEPPLGKLKASPAIGARQLAVDPYGFVDSIWYSDGPGSPNSETFFVDLGKETFDQLGTIVYVEGSAEKTSYFIPDTIHPTQHWIAVNKDIEISYSPRLSPAFQSALDKLEKA